MEWRVTLDESEPFVRVVTRGVFSARDHLRMVEEILSAPFWQPGLAAFFDHRELDFDGATLRDMQQASDNHLRHDHRIGDGRAAILVRDERDFGNARQFEILSSDARTTLRAFMDPDEAEAWLRE